MKTLLKISILLFTTHALAFNPNANKFGIGLNVGQPMGVTAKYWLDKNSAIDATAGFTLGSANSIQFHSDYLHHMYNVINVPQGDMLLFFGGGLRIKFADSDSEKAKNKKTRLGIRLPVGLNYSFTDFETFPFNLYAEIAPVLDLVPKVLIDMNYGVGGRVYF